MGTEGQAIPLLPPQRPRGSVMTMLPRYTPIMTIGPACKRIVSDSHSVKADGRTRNTGIPREDLPQVEEARRRADVRREVRSAKHGSAPWVQKAGNPTHDQVYFQLVPAATPGQERNSIRCRGEAVLLPGMSQSRRLTSEDLCSGKAWRGVVSSGS